MTDISFQDIMQTGQKYFENQSKVTYLTPSEPLTYDTNKIVYKEAPTIESWKEDVIDQKKLHLNQGSNHLAFTFPENFNLNNEWKALLKKENYQLGLLELYTIEPKVLMKLKKLDSIEISLVDNHNLEDYLALYKSFALPYGEEFANESVSKVREQFKQDNRIKRLVAYYDKSPAGILDMIVKENTIEIDGFGVLEQFQHKGIGSTMQRKVAEVAQSRTIILVADGEETAKDMYAKQGYQYKGFVYHIVKENMNDN